MMVSNIITLSKIIVGVGNGGKFNVMSLSMIVFDLGDDDSKCNGIINDRSQYYSINDNDSQCRRSW